MKQAFSVKENVDRGFVKEKYKRMLAGMQRKQKKTGEKSAEKWFLYMLKCSDLSLYTGIAKDIDKRFKVHSSGKGARYTRTRLPLEIVYREPCKSRTDALVREFKVKKLKPLRKRLLAEAFKQGPKALAVFLKKRKKKVKKKRNKKS